MKEIQINPNIQAKREEIIKIVAKYGGSNIRIFGSYAIREATINSDLDLLVDIETGRSLLNRIGMMQELEDLLGIKVDIAKPENLHQCISEQVLKEAISL